MKYLVVGLGNIGAEYADTRHNIGFRVLDALAEASNVSFMAGRYGSTATVRHKGRQILLLKPSTYMNLSGKAVRYWMEQEKIPIEKVLIKPLFAVICIPLCLALSFFQPLKPTPTRLKADKRNRLHLPNTILESVFSLAIPGFYLRFHNS